MLGNPRSRRRLAALPGLGALALSGCESPRAQPAEGSHLARDSATVVSAAALAWRPLETRGFPAGRRIAVLRGDPAGTGPYTIRLSLPDGYRLPAHSHATDEQITVISGTFLFAMGARFHDVSLRAFEPGDFLIAPARAPHYGGAEGATVIELHGTGPFETTVVDPYLPTARRR